MDLDRKPAAKESGMTTHNRENSASENEIIDSSNSSHPNAASKNCNGAAAAKGPTIEESDAPAHDSHLASLVQQWKKRKLYQDLSPKESKRLLIGSKNDNEGKSITAGQFQCSCSKGRCLKLYCSCFKRGFLCHSSCICGSCFNSVSNTPKCNEIRHKTILELSKQDPMVFYRNRPSVLQKQVASPLQVEEHAYMGLAFCKTNSAVRAAAAGSSTTRNNNSNNNNNNVVQSSPPSSSTTTTTPAAPPSYMDPQKAALMELCLGRRPIASHALLTQRYDKTSSAERGYPQATELELEWKKKTLRVKRIFENIHRKLNDNNPPMIALCDGTKTASPTEQSQAENILTTVRNEMQRIKHNIKLAEENALRRFEEADGKEAETPPQTTRKLQGSVLKGAAGESDGSVEKGQASAQRWTCREEPFKQLPNSPSLPAQVNGERQAMKEAALEVVRETVIMQEASAFLNGLARELCTKRVAAAAANGGINHR